MRNCSGETGVSDRRMSYFYMAWRAVIQIFEPWAPSDIPWVWSSQAHAVYRDVHDGHMLDRSTGPRRAWTVVAYQKVSWALHQCCGVWLIALLCRTRYREMMIYWPTWRKTSEYSHLFKGAVEFPRPINLSTYWHGIVHHREINEGYTLNNSRSAVECINWRIPVSAEHNFNGGNFVHLLAEYIANEWTAYSETTKAGAFLKNWQTLGPFQIIRYD